MTATDTRLSLSAFIARERIRCRAEYQGFETEDGWGHDAWKVTLTRNGKRLTVPFRMGSGHNQKEPTALDVLECLLSDAASIENARSFEEWAEEPGFDTDSRKAEQSYRQCEAQHRKLKAWLGSERLFEEALWDLERG